MASEAPEDGLSHEDLVKRENLDPVLVGIKIATRSRELSGRRRSDALDSASHNAG